MEWKELAKRLLKLSKCHSCVSTLTMSDSFLCHFPAFNCCWGCQVASVVSDSVRPHRRQPTRLRCPWDSPGKNTGVGCHCLLQCMKGKSESEDTQSGPTLHDSMDCSPPGSSIHGIFQARVLERVAIAFSSLPLENWFYFHSEYEIYLSSQTSSVCSLETVMFSSL